MTYRLILAFGMVVGALVWRSPSWVQELFRTEPTSNSVIAAVLVPAERLNVETAIAVSREFLEKVGVRTFVLLRIVTEKGQAYPPPRPPRPSYEGWIRIYDRFKALNWNMAETVAFGGSAVVKFRDNDGKVTRIVLEGQDPTQLVAESKRFEFLHVDLLRNPTGALADVRLYLRSSQPLDTGSGDALTALLARRLPFRRATVCVRRDFWFIEEEGFPHFYPFSDGTEPPTEAEYHQSATMYCSYGWGNDACRITGNSR